MRFFSYASIAALTYISGFSNAAAVPSTDCLNHSQVQTILTNFKFLLQNTNSTKFAPAAMALLSPDFSDTSDSVNFAAGFPLGSVTFPNRTYYIEQFGQQRPFPSLETLEAMHNCNKIIWRWNATGFPGAGLEVVGINILTVKHPSSGIIDAVHEEFNSAAFLANLGNPQCQ